MTSMLNDKKVLVVGRGSGIARAITEAARAAGATVTVAGREREELAQAYEEDPGVSAESVDLTDDLDRDAVRRSFDTKVIGPLMLARAFRDQIADGGSILVFSGVAAFDIEPGTLAVAITNGAADTLTRSLAVELAPIRVDAISPGVIDTGAWDALGEDGKAKLFADKRQRNPTRRIGTVEDVAEAAMLALTNTFMTGLTLHVDGGERLT
jgi:NAD(P)-dependent dehydrogenase (short-subunit alcohol dehydrogenase family)